MSDKYSILSIVYEGTTPAYHIGVLSYHVDRWQFWRKAPPFFLLPCMVAVLRIKSRYLETCVSTSLFRLPSQGRPYSLYSARVIRYSTMQEACKNWKRATLARKSYACPARSKGRRNGGGKNGTNRDLAQQTSSRR
jgi:hypothetical protein